MRGRRSPRLTFQTIALMILDEYHERYEDPPEDMYVIDDGDRGVCRDRGVGAPTSIDYTARDKT